MPDVSVPLIAADRPFYRGNLVPFTVKWFDGVPDFKVTDRTAVINCIRGRQCGLCGQVMGKFVTFIGGPKSMKSRLFNDPAMHLPCAQYAMKVCPFLRGDIVELSPRVRADVTVDLSVSQRRARVGYLTTRTYRPVVHRDNLYIFAHHGTIRWEQ